MTNVRVLTVSSITTVSDSGYPKIWTIIPKPIFMKRSGCTFAFASPTVGAEPMKTGRKDAHRPAIVLAGRKSDHYRSLHKSQQHGMDKLTHARQ